MSGCGCRQSPTVISGCQSTGAARLPVGALCPGSTPCQHCETTPLCDSAPYRVAATADSTDPTPYYTIANTHAALDPVVAQTILNGGTGTFPADDGTHNGQHTWLAGVVHIDPTSLCGNPASLTISASVHVHNDGPNAACQLYGRFALWNGTTPIRSDLLGPPNLPAGGDDNGVIPPTTVPLADVLAGRVVVELNLETGNDDTCRVGPKQWTVDSFVLTVQASAPGRGRSFLRTTCRNCDGVITCTSDTLDGSTPTPRFRRLSRSPPARTDAPPPGPRASPPTWATPSRGAATAVCTRPTHRLWTRLRATPHGTRPAAYSCRGST